MLAFRSVVFRLNDCMSGAIFWRAWWVLPGWVDYLSTICTRYTMRGYCGLNKKLGNYV